PCKYASASLFWQGTGHEIADRAVSARGCLHCHANRHEGDRGDPDCLSQIGSDRHQRAKADELMTPEGIGEARGAAIIKGRPYARKDELVQKKIIPASVYNEIKDHIVAKQ